MNINVNNNKMKKSQQIGSLLYLSHKGSTMKDRSDGLCYTKCIIGGNVLFNDSWSTLAGTRNSSMGSPHRRIDPTTHRTMSERSYHGATSRSLEREIAQWVHPMKDRCDDPSHHERTLLPRSYISLLGTRNSSMGSPHEGSIRRPIAP